MTRQHFLGLFLIPLLERHPARHQGAGFGVLEERGYGGRIHTRVGQGLDAPVAAEVPDLDHLVRAEAQNLGLALVDDHVLKQGELEMSCSVLQR